MPKSASTDISTEGRNQFWLRDSLIVAIDTPELAQARDLALSVSPYCAKIKLGLEFYLSCGWQGVNRVAASRSIFLDLKLHDIPNTVGKTVRRLARQCQPGIISVHGAGGAEMVAAAKNATKSVSDNTLIAAVTRLTSLPADEKETLANAYQAVLGGADCLICSPLEIALLRREYGLSVKLICPGIRVANTPSHDQKRTMPPLDAIEAGADWIVVGRPITAAPDPARAARELFTYG